MNNIDTIEIITSIIRLNDMNTHIQDIDDVKMVAKKLSDHIIKINSISDERICLLESKIEKLEKDTEEIKIRSLCNKN